MAVEITLLNSNSVSNIETNFQRVKNALQETVGRDGDTPNEMSADLDMNSNDLLNVGVIQAQDITIDGTDATGILTRAETAAEEAEVSAEEAAISAQEAAASAAIAAGTVNVNTRTALKALDTTLRTVAILTEASREGVFVWNAGDYSAEVAADTLEGIYIKADGVAATAGAWVRQYTGLADVRWFGAVLDGGATDDANAFNVALSVAKDVFFPGFPARINDMVQVPNNGNLIGEGVARSRFIIPSNFNMAAEAVVKMGTSENQSFIDKIGFEFVQPTDGIRANIYQYPPAIGHNNIPRVRIGHVRFSRAYDGVDAGGNAGGATYDWIECGSLNVGLYIDGALDTMNIGRFRVWPFGMSATGGIGDVYRDGSTFAAKIGRCDGLEGEIHTFRGMVDFLGTGVGSAGRHLHALHLDGDGARLRVLDGPLDIDYLYCTKTGAPTNPSILLDGAGSPRVRISNIDLRTSEDAQAVLVNTGSLYINAGRMDHRSPTKEMALVQGGTLAIRNTELSAIGTRTTPYVRSNNAAATLVVQNCFAPQGTGTGQLISLLAANPNSLISENAYGGRTLSVATGVAVGRIREGYGGYVNAAGVGSLPGGWSVAKTGTGQYDITHNLGWSINRQMVLGQAPAAGDTTVVWDKASSTTSLARIRTHVDGVLTDREFTFSIDHV